MKESSFQIKVVRWLRKHNFVCFSCPNGMHVADVINLRMNKLMGLTNGVSDLIVLLPNGRCVFLELKIEGGKQSKEQALFETIVKSMGFEYKIVKPSQNWKELYEWLLK